MPTTAVTSERNDTAYLCHDCLAVFLFKSDVENHAEETGHKSAATLKVDALVKLGDRDFLLFELR
jgi:hypothetical protein